MSQKMGIGYDIHPLVEGRKLFLGGVEIPHEKGLEGHSDADVVIHAICDAILGALGLGDIGEHFSENDPQYKNISSTTLLQKVNDLMQDQGYRMGNIDTIIHAETPHLKEYKGQMKFHLAYALAIEESLINIKATRNEGMGAVGRNEGIAAFASVLIVDHQ